MPVLRILIVDDEPALLALFKRHLERAGHAVTACESAEEAAGAMREPAWEPDLLIFDETLPGQSGAALAAPLLVRFPRLACLLCSGYPLSIQVFPAEVRQRTAILQKPFTPWMLERAMADLLAAVPGP